MRLSSMVVTKRSSGANITLGRCGKCHAVLGMGSATTQGVRCRVCAIQYDSAGAAIEPPWPEKAERLLAAAQTVCSESYEDGNEDGNLGLSERVDCVPKEVMDDLKAIVTEISDDVVTLIRKVQADAADES